MTAIVSKRTIFTAAFGTVCAFLTLVVLATVADAAVHHGKRGRETVVSGEIDLASMKRARGQNSVIRITQSPGGSGAGAMELARASGVVVDGTCNSACAWAFVTNPRACFTANASFGFHAAHDPGTGRHMGAATDYWLGQVNGALRSRLDGLRSTSKLITVNANEMARYYRDRACAGNSRVAQARVR
jgi:hypothetical protein